MREASTRWARERFDLVVGFGLVTGALFKGSVDGNPRKQRRYASGERGEGLRMAGEIGEKGERPLWARFSNLLNYAVTGVKAQAFVRVLFQKRARQSRTL